MGAETDFGRRFEEIVLAFPAKDAATASRALSDLLEETVLDLAKRHLAGLRAALYATGGFARREIFPASDIDILLVVEDDSDGEATGIADFVNALWLLGPALGHSVRSIRTAAAKAHTDATVATALIERRLIFGQERIEAKLKEALARSFDAKAFLKAKIEERQARHARLGASPHTMEPNVKESAGGLREAHFAQWVAKACDLPLERLLTESERQCLHQSYAQLAALRFALQAASRRPDNTLRYDNVQGLAATLGFAHAGELWQAAFQARENLLYLSEVVLSSALKALEDQSAKAPVGFYVAGSLLEHGAPDGPEDFFEALSLFKNGNPLLRFGPNLLRLLHDAPPAVRHNERFRALLKTPKGLSRTLAALAVTGGLFAVIPELSRIRGLLQSETFHVRTADDHTLAVLEEIEAIATGAALEEDAPLIEAAQRLESPDLLFAAALFHDIGKAQPGAHETTGAALTLEICPKMGFDKEETAFVASLVQNHLRMSLTAQKEDFTDPGVLGEFAKACSSLEMLRALYVLTVADIRATNPRIFTAWKASLLSALYLEAGAYLGRKTAGSRQTLLAEKTRSLEAALSPALMPREVLKAFLERMPPSFVARLTVETLAFVAGSFATRQVPSAAARILPGAQALEVAIHVPDAEGLFASVLAFFASESLSVLSAQILTTRDGCALDVFTVEDLRRRPAEDTAAFVRKALPAALSSPRAPRESRARFTRKAGRIASSASVRLVPTNKSETLWEMQVAAADRLGLLHDIARAVNKAGAAFVSAKIMTLDFVVEDRFLIEGEALAQAETRKAIEEAVKDVIA